MSAKASEAKKNNQKSISLTPRPSRESSNKTFDRQSCRINTLVKNLSQICNLYATPRAGPPPVGLVRVIK